MNNFDEWKRFMRASIQSASIVKQCHWKMERGAGAIADLWEEAITASERGDK